jgi:hypothetical protein
VVVTKRSSEIRNQQDIYIALTITMYDTCEISLFHFQEQELDGVSRQKVKLIATICFVIRPTASSATT